MSLFSVVITAYNKGKFIKDTVQSVLKQTVQDLEVIVVDDGSTDNTRREVLSLKDKRLKYFYQDPSGLPACSRNRGIENSTGRYIALLDGDDTWFPEKLERTLDVFLKYPETHIVCHELNITSEEGKFVRRTYHGPYPKDMYSKLMWEGNCLGITMAVLKREVFFKHNFWFDEDERLFAVEDYDFWLRLAETGKFNFYHLPEVFAEHIISEKSIVLSNIEKSTINALYLFDKNVKKYNYDKSGKKILIKKRRSSMMKSAALLYNYRRDYRKSLFWFTKAIKEYPLDRSNYIGPILSLFGIRLGRI